MARRIGGAHACTCPSTSFAGPPPRTGEDRKRMDSDAARLHLDRLALPRQVIGALAIDLDRRIGRRHLLDRPSEARQHRLDFRSEEHTSELQSLMRISYAVFC